MNLETLIPAAPLVAGVMIAVGLSYLIAGKVLFRVFIAGIGIALGMEMGRWLASWLDSGTLWLPYVTGAVLGAAAWPLWQVVVFVLAGGSVGLLIGEIARDVSVDTNAYLLGAFTGFVFGGFLAIALMRAATVAISALVGSALVLFGTLGLLGGKVSLLGALEAPGWWQLLVFLGVAAVGVTVQCVQPAAEEMRRRWLDKSLSRAKSDEEAESRRRYSRYLARGAG